MQMIALYFNLKARNPPEYLNLAALSIEIKLNDPMLLCERLNLGFLTNAAVSFVLFRNAEDPLQRRPPEDQTSLHGGRLHHGVQLAAQPQPTQCQPQPAATHMHQQKRTHGHTLQTTPRQ